MRLFIFMFGGLYVIYDKSRLIELTNTQDQMYLYYILEAISRQNDLLTQILMNQMLSAKSDPVAEEETKHVDIPMTRTRGRKKVVHD